MPEGRGSYYTPLTTLILTHSFFSLFLLWILGKLYTIVFLPFADSSLSILADAWASATFGLGSISLGGFFYRFFRFFFRLDGLGFLDCGSLFWLGLGLVGFWCFLFLFFRFCGFFDVRMVYLMIDDVVNELGTVTVLIVNTHLGSNDFEVVQRLLIEFKNVVHK